MSISEISLVAGIFTTISITVLYIFFYINGRQKLLRPWMGGWVFYLINEITRFIMIGGTDNTALFIIRQTASLFCSYLFMKGTCKFFRRPVHSHWLKGLEALFVWVLVASILNVNAITVIIPVHFLAAAMLIKTGLIIRESMGKTSSLRTFLEYTFIIWGLYKFAYVFIWSNGYYNVIGGLITVVVQYSAAIGVVMTSFDTAKRELEAIQEMHSESESRYESLFEHNHSIMLLICPEKGIIVEANDAACKYYGYSREEFINMDVSKINPAGDLVIRERLDWTREENKLYFLKQRLASGEIRDIEAYSGPIKVQGKTLIYTIVHDITERKRAEEMIKKMAYYDDLTELPKKALFMEYLVKAINQAKENKGLLGILLLDFDRFKNINDTLGQDAGDKFLKTVSERIKAIVGREDFVARVGGDEFAILLPEIETKESALNIAEALVNEFRTPTRVDKYELFSTVSVGVAFSPFDGEDEESLMRNADIAMFRAKELGRNNLQVFDRNMQNEVLDSFYIANSLVGAIEREELTLYYQPMYHMVSGRITGVEALLRWKHPLLGNVSPGDFIPIAEETGMIIQIGEWVLREACLQNMKWREEGLPEINMAVNISGRQIQSDGFLDMVKDVLRETGIDPGCLELEITESTAVKNINETNRIIEELKKLGLKISMDDFGTGYSALSTLNQLNLDILKIDQSFIRSISMTPKGKELTEIIINMAHTLDLMVIAEGVETNEHMEFLWNQKCDFIQGYYISKPVPQECIKDMLLEQEMVV